MIQPISQSISKYPKFKNTVAFKNQESGYNSTDKNNSHFEQRLLMQNEKTNLLLAVLVFAALTKVVIDLFSKPSRKNMGYDVSLMKQEFKSLADNTKIPTIENCRSINDNLKTILQRHINQLKAGKDILSETVKPQANNRLLLYGSAGVGKSYFAKIFAKSIDAEYMEIMYSDFNSVWSGEDINNFKQIFENILEQAQKNPSQKYVVTFNEIDAIVQPADRFSKNTNGSHYLVKLEERSVFLNYLEILKEKAPNVTVIGTTNISPKNNGLDRAAMSRFQNLVEVPYPDKECLYEALKMNLDKIKNKDKFISENDTQLKDLAQKMADRKFSFRNLEYIVNDAKGYHLDDSVSGKKNDFKFEYLKKAEQNLKLSDGELEKTSNKT